MNIMEKFDIDRILEGYVEFGRFCEFLKEIRKEGGINKYICLVEDNIDRSRDLTYKNIWRENLKWLKDNRDKLGRCEKGLIN